MSSGPRAANGTVTSRAQRDPDRWKVDPSNGSVRFTGRGKRGFGSFAIVDDHDLATAIKELVAARAMLAEAYALSPGRARREAVAVAIGKIALAGRYVDDLVIRRGGRCPDVSEP